MRRIHNSSLAIFKPALQEIEAHKQVSDIRNGHDEGTAWPEAFPCDKNHFIRVREMLQNIRKYNEIEQTMGCEKLLRQRLLKNAQTAIPGRSCALGFWLDANDLK